MSFYNLLLGWREEAKQDFTTTAGNVDSSDTLTLEKLEALIDELGIKRELYNPFEYQPTFPEKEEKLNAWERASLRDYDAGYFYAPYIPIVSTVA